MSSRQGGSLKQYWIEPQKLAGGPCPSTSDLSSLRKTFDTIISLLEDDRQYLYKPGDAASKFRWYNVPMKDHATPHLGQLVEVCDILWSLPNTAKAYIHCLAGIGRTGTVAAGHLVLGGLTAEDALRQVDGWTGGLYSHEISSRQQEVLDLLERFRRLFRGRRS